MTPKHRLLSSVEPKRVGWLALWIGLMLLSAMPFRGDAAEPVQLPDVSKWAKEFRFQFAWEASTNSVESRERKLLLSMMVFREPDGFFLQYYLNESGQEYDQYNNLPLGRGGSTGKEMSESAMKVIRRALTELPEKNQTPPMAQLLILNYWDGSRWITRTFDRSDCPPAVTTIRRMLGKRFDE